MPDSKLDLLQGTLDLMVLQTLDAMGPLHGYGIARRIEQLSGDEVLLNQGTIYASLVRLQQRLTRIFCHAPERWPDSYRLLRRFATRPSSPWAFTASISVARSAFRSGE